MELKKRGASYLKRRKRGCLGCSTLFLIPLLILVLYIGFNVYKGFQVDIGELRTIEQKETFVATKDMQPYVKNAFIAVEDKRFNSHDGVDWLGTARAIIISVKNGEASQGGSSITQQLAKTYFFNNEKSISRKIKEVVVAKRIENNFTKDQILSYYLNTIYFGNNHYNIESAANADFNASTHKDNQYYPQITILQSAILASTINAPSLYHPEAYQSDAALITRTKATLQKMLEQNYINENQYNEALRGL
ncbi:glycosyltransferase [Macrococcoides caseolyticum]|uniref:glycosyltransferase n=1 Tax=Macrococcoides caseolyticum TaxID=69966 RepID=UPI001F374094|nr:glycosyltransferase [Macrococcus caseolyticus]MCE4957517.1 glycosyltransferase [Macrococcus caseolyticus]